MFVRDHLAIVALWAKDRLRDGAESPDADARLKQLVTAAEALCAELAPEADFEGNVVALKDFRRRGLRKSG